MLGEQNRFPDGFTVTEVYVKHIDNSSFSGLVLHPLENMTWQFNDIVSLMRIFETFFSSFEFPQATHQLRGFSNNKYKNQRGLDALNDLTTNEIADGKPTFVVKIQYRQNASWQGTITWVDKNIEKNFRSCLELIKLMDEATLSDNDVKWE